jgi:hypothetical protein
MSNLCSIDIDNKANQSLEEIRERTVSAKELEVNPTPQDQEEKKGQVSNLGTVMYMINANLGRFS